MDDTHAYKTARISALIDKYLKEQFEGFQGSYLLFADALNEPLKEAGITFSKQTVWTWGKGLHLPHLARIKILSEYAELGSWQAHFAKEVIEIIEETRAERSIRELGF